MLTRLLQLLGVLPPDPPQDSEDSYLNLSDEDRTILWQSTPKLRNAWFRYELLRGGFGEVRRQCRAPGCDEIMRLTIYHARAGELPYFCRRCASSRAARRNR